METHSILSDRFLVEGADGSPSSENWVQTILAEEVSTLCLHRVPHCEQTDWTLMPLQERTDKFCLVPWHLLCYVTAPINARYILSQSTIIRLMEI